MLRLHSTLGGRSVAFVPLEAGRVSLYTCGPTVYDFAHIGNFRSFLAADVLRRWLESPLCRRAVAGGEVGGEAEPEGEDPLERLDDVLRGEGGAAAGGYAVTHVMNITDVGHMTEDDVADGSGEDKMEAATKRLLENKKAGTLPAGAPEDLDPRSPWDIARFYAEAFKADARALNMGVAFEAVDDETVMPRATASIGGMLRLIVDLFDAGVAYAAGDAVYFDTAAFPEYGALSGNTLESIRAGAGGRVDDRDVARKRHPADFLLWKHDPKHLMRWDPAEVLSDEPALARRVLEAGLGEGYPGWHAECSAMARSRLGDVIDIHTGGEDLVFPHHECEIAQSRCATGREEFARYWLHTRFLQVEGRKMSKSAGNFYTAREILERGFSASALRLTLVGTHYRASANFTERALKDNETVVGRWRRFVEAGEAAGGDGNSGNAEARARCARGFVESMNDDLNVAGGVAALNTFVREVSEPGGLDAALVRVLDGALGVLGATGEGVAGSGGDAGADASAIEALIERRQRARQEKDFAEADRIRDELAGMGVELEDTADGPKWRRRVGL